MATAAVRSRHRTGLPSDGRTWLTHPELSNCEPTHVGGRPRIAQLAALLYG
ncbi:hypothetical protein ACFT5D_00300 [Streptomyces sp. NPDC057144]|uniref:hypothetical protein n=1 Tax=Streptomyces TaxID=1883 RepID=UPI0033E6BD76